MVVHVYMEFFYGTIYVVCGKRALRWDTQSSTNCTVILGRFKTIKTVQTVCLVLLMNITVCVETWTLAKLKVQMAFVSIGVS